MKKIYIFLIIAILISCAHESEKQVKSNQISCPFILFSKDHNTYMGTSSSKISLENISYTATINNANFSKGCNIQKSFFNSDLTILFVVNSINKKQEKIYLPFYIAVIDQNENLINIDYYSTEGTFKKDIENNSILETEIIATKNIRFDYSDEISKIIVGFILDKERLKILN